MRQSIARSTCLLVLLLSVSETTAAIFTSPELDATLQAAAVGDEITLPFSSPNSMRAINASPRRLVTGAGTLLYSDDPETALEPGILYRDVLPAGPQRIYLYHVNGLQTQHRFSIVAENLTTEPADIVYTRRSLPSPTGNYVLAGREGVRLFYENTNLPAPITIPPQGKALIDPVLDGMNISRNQLVAGIHEYTSSQPLRVSTVMIPTGVNTLAAMDSIAFATNDDRNRQGTFPGLDRLAHPDGYTWSASEGIVRLRIGDNPTFSNVDPPAAGTNAEAGNVATTLPGNYGITYDVELVYTNNLNKRAAVLLNPRGGAYGGYFRVFLNDTLASASLVPLGKLNIQAGTPAGVIALLDPPPGNSTIRFQTIPAGASSLAIDILFVPYGESTVPPLPSDSWMFLGE